jgi:intein/homing endonuclease
MGMDEEYAQRKHGKEYDMPEFLREQLKETYGVITYQEQCCPYDVGVLTSNGYVRIGDIVTKKKVESVLCVNDKGDVVERSITHYHDNGEKDVYRFVLDNGFVLECTEDHRVMTQNRGWVEAKSLTPEDDIMTTDSMGNYLSPL